jgi:hypothetical protein
MKQTLPQRNLDFLIPPQILKLCSLDQFDFRLKLKATPIDNRFPRARIIINDQIIVDREIQTIDTIEYSTRLDLSNPNFKIKIEYYGKTNRDTKVSQSYEIIENQSLEIVECLINNIDIVASNIIYSLGYYYMSLPPEKYNYFKANGFDTGPTHSLSMFENGYWELNLTAPVSTQFAQFKSKYEKHVNNWPNNALLNEIYTTIENIRFLEKQLNS